ncbi:MAG TPA: DUF6036 family nucleotidyltransferase [Terriglobales bacterium]
MPKADSIPEPWQSFFKAIEGSITEEVALHCLGGFVVTMLYGLQRTTSDVDVLTVAPFQQLNAVLKLAGRGSMLHKRSGLYLDYVTIATIPEEYEERLREMFPEAFPRLRLFACDPYDIALSKLERNIQRDRDDVKYLARVVPFNLELLKDRYEKELRPNLGNPHREDLTLKLWIEAIEEERNAQKNKFGDRG